MSVKNVKNKQIIYGLTGGIASGKTTAINFFLSKDVLVFDSDKYVKYLWETNKNLKDEVKKRYNININTKEGKNKLAKIIFEDDFERFYINNLIHPLVFNGIKEFKEKNKNEPFLIIDMPLLFEVGFDREVDKTILIYTKRKNQIKRLMKRDSLTKKEAIKRIKAQIRLKDKVRLSNYVIKNNKDLKSFNVKLEEMYEVMVNESK